ncbi:hypothetical protein ACP4OV_025203 [Aristida adscensionis]
MLHASISSASETMMHRIAMLPLAFVVFALVWVSRTSPASCYVPHGAARPSTGGHRHPHGGAARTYIVFVEPPPAHVLREGDDGHRRWHESFLPRSGGDHPRRRLRHSYAGVVSGFAARLTAGELAQVSARPGFVRAIPERRVQLMTTRTPAFLGLAPSRGAWNVTGYGKGVIIGLLDTGIDEKHPSFADEGMPAPPARWKGTCGNTSARCNNKLIGAASFVLEGGTVDDVGHGTHTAGTAAGGFVDGVSAFGLGKGTASGVAPGAHLAVYKVCDAQGCFESDILAGMDAAVADGVDVLSLSLGGPSLPLDRDPIAIGAFGVVSRGVAVVCAGGNSGPMRSTLSNEAPWILTVTAGSVDRSFRAAVRLGDGETFDGESLTQDTRFSAKAYPLYYSQGTNYCDFFDVNITGAVVVCDTETPVPPMSSIDAVREAGGAGVVFINEADFGYTIVLEKYYNIPMSQVTAADGHKIMGYAMRGSPASMHTATIVFNNSLVGVKPAPTVAAFSSRGPSTASPGVPKPDIMAPGLNILAAWPSQVPVGEAGGEAYDYNVVSGTSMATPHVAGVVALVKKAHPEWSPAAIKSAIMTTSTAVGNDGRPIADEAHRTANFYALGAGHAVPAKAIDPGLVYDLGERDYAGYICSLLGEAALRAIAVNTSLTCKELAPVAEAQLNYPAILVPLRAEPFTASRTVTNVGPARSKYTAKVNEPEGMAIKVEPSELKFTEVGERKAFTVTVSARAGAAQSYAEGSLRWVSQEHVVRSPIVADSSVAV